MVGEIEREGQVTVGGRVVHLDEVSVHRPRQAATIAREAGARRLVLAHYSQRHPNESVFLAEAAEIHPDVVAARDLDVIGVPSRVG